MALAVSAVPVVAATGEGRIDDPRDVGTRIDVKALTHSESGSVIVYTAETYAPFTDQAAVFKWGIDRDGDEAFDLIVFTEWRDGKLAGGVKDAGGREVGPAAVSRPGPTVIRVSFPASVLGGTAEYRYAVGAGPGTGSGGRDLAPNAGLIQHTLGAAAPAGTRQAAGGESPPARAEAAAAPGRTPAAALDPSAAPDVSAPAPSGTANPAAGTTTNLPRTGPGDRRALLALAGAAFLAGGALIGMRGAR